MRSPLDIKIDNQGHAAGFALASARVRDAILNETTKVQDHALGALSYGSASQRRLYSREPRRFVHVDQIRYPGISWEIDRERRCWVIDADGTRTPDPGSRPHDYLYKVADGWWKERPQDEGYRPLTRADEAW